MAWSALVSVLLLASSSASPVLRTYDDVDGALVDGHSTTTVDDPNDSTWRQENVAVSHGHFNSANLGSGPSGSAPVTKSQPASGWSDYGISHIGGEYTPPQEQNTAQVVSGWDDDSAGNNIRMSIASPSGAVDTPGYYEHDEQQPPVVVGKSGSPTDEFTDDPNFDGTYSSESVAHREVDTGSRVSSRNGSKTVQAANAIGSGGELAKQTPPRNASRLGLEVGSEEFEQTLGDALIDTLHKMKAVLAGRDQYDQDSGDWQSAFSRLRVKRSEENSEEDSEDSSEELPVRSLNDIVDVFLIVAKQSLEDRGLDQVSIPSLEETFSQSLGVGTLRGFFRGDDGWVRRLTTVQRVANVRLDRGPKPPEGEQRDVRSVSVATSLGLEELMVGFEHYVADVRALPTVSGRLLADIDDNAVLLNISFSKRDDDPKGCDVVLQELKVQRLEGINLKLTGLGPLNWLLSRIATWLTRHSQDKVAGVIEKQLIKIANKELGKIPCDADFITAVSML